MVISEMMELSLDSVRLFYGVELEPKLDVSETNG